MDYNGRRTRDDLINFVSSVNQRGTSFLATTSELKQMIDNSRDKTFISFAKTKEI